jgi:hypothetical protein
LEDQSPLYEYKGEIANKESCKRVTFCFRAGSSFVLLEENEKEGVYAYGY